MELQATAHQTVVTVTEDCINSSIDFAVGRDSTCSLTQSVLHDPIENMEQQETNEAVSLNLDSYQSPKAAPQDNQKVKVENHINPREPVFS